jgi:tetrahydromethanopterin S-methyltransferase subunit C
MGAFELAMLLAKVVPTIGNWLKSDDKAGDAAGAVVDIAKAVTGQADPETAVRAIQADPKLAMEFELAVMKNKTDFDAMYLQDTQNARARDIEFTKAGIVNHRANVLAGAAILLVVVCLAVVIWSTNADDFAKATISLILGRALGWVEQLFSFEFGTTRANKTKDDTINNLSK